MHLADPSGPSRTLAPVLRSLANGDGNVVAAVPGPGRLAGELRGVARVVVTGHAPVTIPRRPGDAWSLATRLRHDVRQFRALLRRERPDLAIVATTTLPALILAARLERVPTIVYATELYRQGSRGDVLRAAAGRAMMRVNARLASVTVASSRTVARTIAMPRRTIVAYPSIDPALAEGDADAFRRRHGLPADGPCLATLGNIARGRGQDVAIRALADLRRDHPGAYLVIAGEPHPRPRDRGFAVELRELAERLGVGGAVHFCGFERTGDVLAACEVLLNPARFGETFGRVAMEALLAGRPVVSSRVGAVAEVLEDGRHALLVPPDRPGSLADAVRRLLADPALAARLVTQGAAHVRATFTAERQLAGFDAAIDSALHTARGNGRRR
ncbi:MAG TPA: glycosyltransferase family 4 protein [Solirubrobacteraceae bacterium]|nr:glycosyltransferase family 4 protein [Solirubrobacteraceae bacterium]